MRQPHFPGEEEVGYNDRPGLALRIPPTVEEVMLNSTFPEMEFVATTLLGI